MGNHRKICMFFHHVLQLDRHFYKIIHCSKLIIHFHSHFQYINFWMFNFLGVCVNGLEGAKIVANFWHLTWTIWKCKGQKNLLPPKWAAWFFSFFLQANFFWTWRKSSKSSPYQTQRLETKTVRDKVFIKKCSLAISDKVHFFQNSKLLMPSLILPELFPIPK